MRKDQLGVCPRCGDRDWYVKGAHKACRRCQREAVRRYQERKAMGTQVEGRERVIRPLSELLRVSENPLGERNRRKTHCPAGHPLSGPNMRLDVHNGKMGRVCKACKRNRANVRYGLSVGKSLSSMLLEAS